MSQLWNRDLNGISYGVMGLSTKTIGWMLLQSQGIESLMRSIEIFGYRAWWMLLFIYLFITTTRISGPY